MPFSNMSEKLVVIKKEEVMKGIVLSVKANMPEMSPREDVVNVGPSIDDEKLRY